MKRTLIPRITTRGYYDLSSGKTIKHNSYNFYPKKFLKKLETLKESVIMIHGFQNNKQNALKKFKIAKNRLKKLGYRYPVIGYSYDSNVKGAHLKKQELKALRIGQKIAAKNGKNLSKFVIDLKQKNPAIKIRLMGHSLGSEIILSALKELHRKTSKSLVESVYFFGSSIPIKLVRSKKIEKIFQRTVKSKIVNYFSPHDEVLQYSHTRGYVKNPIGLTGKKFQINKYYQMMVKPKNHRFVNYARVLTRFP